MRPGAPPRIAPGGPVANRRRSGRRLEPPGAGLPRIGDDQGAASNRPGPACRESETINLRPKLRRRARPELTHRHRTAGTFDVREHVPLVGCAKRGGLTCERPVKCGVSAALARQAKVRMELKWLEDFVSLAETRSFSRSAELRHVTQPAFSRRIQALEAWLGTELIDRSVYPTRLTQAGQVFYEQALTLLSQMREARTLLRGQSGAATATIEFAVPHTLSLTFFPRWLGRVEARLGRINTLLRALNVHDAVLSLVEGG